MYVLRHYLVPYIQRSFTVTATFINLYKVLWSILKEHETKSHLEWYPVWSGLDSKHPSIPHRTCDHMPSHTCLRDVLDSSTQYMKPTTQRWVAVKKNMKTLNTPAYHLYRAETFTGVYYGTRKWRKWVWLELGKEFTWASKIVPFFVRWMYWKTLLYFFSWHTF